MKYKNFNMAMRWSFASLALIWVAGCIFATTSVSSGGYYRVFGFWVANRAWEGSADWVADRWELALIGLLLICLAFVIVNSIGKVALGQPEDSTLNKVLRVTLKLVIAIILLSGVALPVYDMTSTVLAKANRAFLKGDREKAFELYHKAIALGLDLGSPTVCDSSRSSDIRSCAYLHAQATEKYIEGLSFLKVTDHIWTVQGVDISPRCMEGIWISGDNYEEYEEQYPTKDFRGYPGQYWGGLIPIEPIAPSWGESLSLAKPIESCNVVRQKDSMVIENNVVSYGTHKSFIETGHHYLKEKYTLIAEWGEKECSVLVPNFAGQCQSLAFVKLDRTDSYPDISFNSYAHITDKGKAYIVPVTNGMPLGDLLKLIGNN